MTYKPFTLGEHMERKSYCKHGHEMTPENTRTQDIVSRKNGKTYTVHACKTCRARLSKESAQRKAARKRAAAPVAVAAAMADSVMWI